MNETLWSLPLYQETAIGVIAFLTILGVPSFFLRHRGVHYMAVWASLRSWLIASPILFILTALPSKGPIIILTLFSILGAKIFCQMVGMYHRSQFVWTLYLCIIISAWAIHTRREHLFDLMPMILLGLSCLIPILRNSFKHMIQYVSSTLIAFCLTGWSFMHLARIYHWENGPLILIYIIILTEFSDNIFLLASRKFHSIKPWDRITTRRSLEGLLIAFVLTMILAWGLRGLLPYDDMNLWMTSGVIATCAGSLGDLVLSIVRRDLGIKDVGGFILGRGTLIDLLDRLIFVAPIYYYIMEFSFFA